MLTRFEQPQGGAEGAKLETACYAPVPAASFGMDDPVKEAAFVARLKNDPRAKVIGAYLGTDLLKAGNYIFANDSAGPAFFARWEDEKWSVLNEQKHCTRIAVWTRGGAPPGIPRHVFWEYLFPLRNVMVTDSKQTEEGKRFWYGRVLEALSKGLRVSSFNIVHKGVHPVLTMDDYRKWKAMACGTENRHKNERLAISQ